MIKEEIIKDVTEFVEKYEKELDLITYSILSIFAILFFFRVINIITWSYWIIFSPIWAPLLFIICYPLLFFMVNLFVDFSLWKIIKKLNKRR